MQTTDGQGRRDGRYGYGRRKPAETNHVRLVNPKCDTAPLYPSEETKRRYAQFARRRAERQELQRQAEENRTTERKTIVMVMSGFLFGAIAIAVMTRIGESLLSSVVYGVMIGVAVNLVFLIAMSLCDKYDIGYAYDYDYFDDEDDYDEEPVTNDFAGLGSGFGDAGSGIDSPSMLRREREPLVHAPFVNRRGERPARATQPMLPSRPPKDMGDFIGALADDADDGQDDVIVI